MESCLTSGLFLEVSGSFSGEDYSTDCLDLTMACWVTCEFTLVYLSNPKLEKQDRLGGS